MGFNGPCLTYLDCVLQHWNNKNALMFYPRKIQVNYENTTRMFSKKKYYYKVNSEKTPIKRQINPGKKYICPEIYRKVVKTLGYFSEF